MKNMNFSSCKSCTTFEIQSNLKQQNPTLTQYGRIQQTSYDQTPKVNKAFPENEIGDSPQLLELTHLIVPNPSEPTFEKGPSRPLPTNSMHEEDLSLPPQVVSKQNLELEICHQRQFQYTSSNQVSTPMSNTRERVFQSSYTGNLGGILRQKGTSLSSSRQQTYLIRPTRSLLRGESK